MLISLVPSLLAGNPLTSGLCTLSAAAVQLLLSQRRPFLLFSRSYGKEINHSVGSLQQA